MAKFYYRAATVSGEWQQGTRSGPNEGSVARELVSAGLIPIYVGSAPEAEGTVEVARSGGKTRLRGGHAVAAGSSVGNLLARRNLAADRLVFTQELATLLQAGVPLDRALAISAELAESKVFRSVVTNVLRQVRGGKSLAEALEQQGRVFSRLYVNMVRAGQASGSLAAVFQRLAEHETSASEWRGHIISSLIYPVLLTCVALGSMLVLMNFVVPRFAQVFETTGLQMPASTAALVWTGQMLQRYGLLIVAAGIALVVLFRRFIRTSEGRARWDGLLLRVPLLGEMLRKAETARFARTMSTLVGHNVPLVESLRIVKETVGNVVIAGAFDGVIQGVKRGEGIAAPVTRAAVFPPLAGHLLRIGEETGQLDAMFSQLASVYENQTRVALRRFTALFEPAVILTMGIVVGAIVLSLLLAITSINDIPF